MKHLARPALAAMLACAASTHASAAITQATMSFSDFTLTAYDLVANDAYLPSYQLLASNAVTTASSQIVGQPYVVPQTASGLFSVLSSSTFFGVPPLGSNQPPQQASADTGPGGFTLSASGEGSGFVVRASADISGATFSAVNIRIAPCTGILASGNLQINLSADCQNSSSCNASGYFYAGFRNGVAGSSTTYSQTLNTQLGTLTNFSGPAGATYVNFTDHDQDVTLYFNGSVAVAASPVDEPSLAALMIGGLLTTAWLRRGRKANKAGA